MGFVLKIEVCEWRYNIWLNTVSTTVLGFVCVVAGGKCVMLLADLKL